jgi:hypothetical protein
MNSKTVTHARRHGASAHLTPHRKQIGELLIAIDRAHNIAHLHEGVAAGKRRLCHPHGLVRSRPVSSGLVRSRPVSSGTGGRGVE